MTNATPRAAPLPRIIGILMLAALAMPVTSFAQSRDVVSAGHGSRYTPPNEHSGRDPGRLGGPVQRGGRDEDGPIKPVPEPGTMALAAMGLVALGGAIRKRKTA